MNSAKSIDSRQYIFRLSLGAIGIVFGDIGTSPIYALAACFKNGGLQATPIAIQGVISLIVWSLILIVSIKYLLFITKANHEGEGGIFAIMALLKSSGRMGQLMSQIATGIALLAAALLLSDSMITPALSILSAMEGLKSVFDDIDHWIIIGTIGIILLLFSIQHKGTGTLGRLFGPVMVFWFLIIGSLGFLQLIQTPAILKSISPIFAVELILELGPLKTLNLMGSVMLAVTGAEAIYADMGHFGRRPITLAWYSVALLSILLSYFGQGAWLLQYQPDSPEAMTPFFSIIPKILNIPMVILATLATIIASQAVISGMYSLASQAIHLNLIPRLRIEQTSENERGQIYLPKLNRLMLVGSLGFVLVFQSSGALAAAYGFAVAATMFLTTIAFSMVVYYVWRWPAIKLIAFMMAIIPVDLFFFCAAITKIPQGSYVTLILSMITFWLLVAWGTGNRYLKEQAQRLDMPISLFMDMIERRKDLQVYARPAIYLQHLPADKSAPHALLRQLQLTSLLYQPTVIVDIYTIGVPRYKGKERIKAIQHPNGIYTLLVEFGFAERINLDPVIQYGLEHRLWNNPKDIVYYSAREELRTGVQNNLNFWVRLAYVWLHKHDENHARSFHLPALQYVELSFTIDV